ncbi:ABC transporter substrate-binding protein [Halorubrum sp. DTA98]|uniref:ABC transporter substrate-binding protein n=1 Tax=Halorubrum sp. DTA98 TaxID=3402163 RepID=UPI003AAD789A
MLELSLCCDNRDTINALLTGEVEPRGIDLTTLVEYPPRRHRRFFRHGEFDVCEVSLASYLSAMEEPEAYPFTAIPVYPNKRFRHSFVYTHVDSGIDGPADLAGKKMGVQSWQTTANVWARGILGDQYDLDLADVTWYRRKDDDVPISIPDRFDIRPIGGDAVEETTDMREMLFSGELDAATDPAYSLFNAVLESDEVELLFDDPIAEEKAYFEETGIHPPMHLIAIRDEVLEANPWVAVSLYDAFREARDRCLERNENPHEHTSLTWAHLHLKDQRETLGPDVWEWGLTEKTRRELDTFIRYAQDQGLITRRYEPEELFAETVLDV